MSVACAPSDSLAELYRGHHGWLHAWLRRKLGCQDQAADLAHDTFLRVLAAPRLDDIREPRAWLTTIARGLLIDHWRRQDLEQAWLDTLASLPEPVASSPEDKVRLLDALCRIDTMLDQLKPKVREAFLLAQLDDLTYREIGERLGVGERMVKKYMAQAMMQCLLAVDD